MANDPSDAARLERTLAKTTAAALAVSRSEGKDVFGELAAGLAGILEVDATMIGRFDPARPGRVEALATWFDGRLLQPFDYDLAESPCRAMVGRESRFVAAGIRAEFKAGTLFHAQAFDSYAAHSMTDGNGRQIGLIVALHRHPMTDRALTEALLQIFAVRAGAEMERQRTDAAARASEASYRAIFDASEDAIFVHDFDTGRVLDVNPKACRNFGYTHDELLAVRIGDVSSNVPPYTEEEAARFMDRARRGEPVRFEWHRRNKDGSLHWDEVQLKRATIGGRERILAFTREITDRKEAHEALRVREEQYRAIFEGSADALVLWSRDVRIVDVNAAFTAMYGYTREEIVGSTFGDRLPTLDVARRIRMMQRALEGKTGHLETRTIRKTGEAFDVEIRYLPILHRGEPHVLAIARDITERREREKALRASEEQYRGIFNSSVDALVLKDGNHRIVDVNPAFLAMHGYERDELLGRGLSEFMPVELEAHCAVLVPQILAGQPCHIEAQTRRRDGAVFDVEIHGVPMQYGGEPHALIIMRNITESKRAEERLKASEARYRTLFEMESAAVVLVDADTLQLADVNLAAVQMYGHTRQELLRMTATDLSAEPEATAPSIRDGHGALNIPLRWHRRKDGTVFPVEITANRLELDGRQIVLATIRDITDRKSAEAALRASEAQYRAIFETTTDSLQLLDAQHRVVDVNPAYERMYGKRREEVLGRGLHDLVPAPFREERRALVQRALEGEVAEQQTTGFRGDGTPFELEVRVIPFRHGGELHVLGIARDITDRKRAEQALRDSEEQYRAIFNASADALVLRDADFRIVDVNATYEAMSGYSRDAVVGHDRVFANPPADADAIRALHARALAGEQIVIETTLFRRDGARYDLELRGVPIQHRGAPHVLYMGRDVSARTQAEARRRELESQLQQAQKMEAIGHLTGGIAHDFNNILTSVMGYMALASERPAAATDAKLQSHLEQALLSCQRARDLIQQMLAFSRGHRSEPRPVALRPLVSESTRMLRATLPASIELVSRVSGHPVAHVDPVQAHQVVLNLCINARDAMGESGRIVVSADRVKLAAMTCSSCRHTFSGEFAELAVADSGTGIDPEILERMFDPFFTTKDIGRGTGMGLSIVHGVVHEHGGHVVVESRRDVGTTFRVLLPLATPVAADQTTGAGDSIAPRAALSGRVLLVEDEQSVLGFMRELLQGWGLTVVAARDPADALQWFAQEPERFDVVLTDHTMPGMTGVELAGALIARRPGTPVLLYSGRSELLDASAVAAAGVRRLLSKPIDARALHAALRELLVPTPA